MPKKDTVSDLIAYAFMVGGILTLTRPGGRAPQEIESIARGYTNILRVTTGVDEVESQLRLFEDRYMADPDSLPELEAELDRKIGLTRERHHRSWFDAALGHNKVRPRQP